VEGRDDNSAVSALDSKIDELYQLPLSAFTAGRNALAKTLSGADAARVKTLAKPTVVPWAVNQLYWQARPVYDRLMKTGEALRKAQIAALKGRTVDVRRAIDAHRKAVADASHEAAALAEKQGSRPAADDLARMLETLSLAATRPAPAGRLTELLQPSGFEALAGITPADLKAPPKAVIRPKLVDTPPKTDPEDERRRDKEAQAVAAARARAQADLQAAERDVDRAKTQENAAAREAARAQEEADRAQEALARARDVVRAAEQSLAAAKANLA
jgi:hypothetical protein